MKPSPPIARQAPTTTTIHGDTLTDPYSWLNERDNPDVIAYLEAENAYTEAMTAHTKALQETIYQEMRGRIKETDLTVPYGKGPYTYYVRTEEGKQYPIFCRRSSVGDAAEEILLDQNQLAEGSDYFQLGVLCISPDHRLMAYSTDKSGAETYTLYIKDLQTGEHLADEIANTYYSVEWANDNQTLFYTTFDEAKRPFQLYRHTLGTPAEADALVHQEDDNRFFISLKRTRSDAYLIMSIRSNITGEAYYLDANTPYQPFQLLYPRQNGIEYTVTHHEDKFYIRTNEEAENFKLVAVPVAQPDPENWEIILPHRQDVTIQRVDAFKNHLVISTRQNGLQNLHIMDLQQNEAHDVTFPEPTYSVSLGDNKEFNTHQLRFEYTSLITPNSIFDYDMVQRTRELKKQQEVLGGYDPTHYQSERLMAAAADGTTIPISLVYKKGFVKDGQAPLYLTGYGSYGASFPASFSTIRISLLDRGFVFAIAHIRGGGTMGETWRNQGKLLKKKNTFTDFIACAEHLIAEGYTNKEKLAVMGGSAGGLLMGAIVNMRPDLFKVVVAHVPFVDVINTMLDPSIPLTVIEYEEWGNPNDKQYYDYMKSYSPYDNVEAKSYPHLLVTAGLNDPRVQYWEPAKWTAKLRLMKTDDNHLLLKTNMGAGHAGASGRFDRLKENAFEYAFILDQLGIEA